MINDNTILSSFDDKPTLLEWLKKVEDALKSDTATAVSVENPNANTYVFKITFADGTTISSGNVVFPDSVKDVSINNGHIIVTQNSGTQSDLGVLNPYADTIVLNAQTNDVDINGETKINAGLEVLNEINCDNIVAKGAIQTDSDLAVTGNAQVNGRLQVNSSIISNGEIRGGNISGTKFLLGTEEMPLVKANPTGEATQTLEKVKIGDVAYNLGGGSDYTAGSNIEISGSKEIAVKNALTEINSIRVKSVDGDVGISAENYGNFVIKTYASLPKWPVIKLRTKDSNFNDITLIFSQNQSNSQTINFNAEGSGGSSVYAFLTKGSKVPFVPSGDGTYILKASVSRGNVTYTWELQQ